MVIFTQNSFKYLNIQNRAGIKCIKNCENNTNPQICIYVRLYWEVTFNYKYIVLEAPTGFGKCPVAIAVGKTLGTSYICSATKDLQTQYIKDFPYLRTIKGMGNYDCLAKEDFVLNKTLS